MVANGLNGRPVLRFNGDQSLHSGDNFGAALNRDLTFIFVALTTNTSLHRQQFPLYLGQNAASGANRDMAYLEGKEFFDGQWVGFTGPPVIKNRFLMTGVTLNPTLTQVTFYRNGVQTAVSGLDRVKSKVAGFKDLSEGVTMGAATGPYWGWQGDIAEELVYSRQLSATEMQQVWSQLAAKYGLRPTGLAVR